jgi:hypothetical protein
LGSKFCEGLYSKKKTLNCKVIFGFLYPHGLSTKNWSWLCRTPAAEGIFSPGFPLSGKGDSLMKWITRFIDSEDQFLFVPQKKVLEIAEEEGAGPFGRRGLLMADQPGGEFRHGHCLRAHRDDRLRVLGAVYCVREGTVSQGVAERLNQDGLQAAF